MMGNCWAEILARSSCLDWDGDTVSPPSLWQSQNIHTPIRNCNCFCLGRASLDSLSYSLTHGARSQLDKNFENSTQKICASSGVSRCSVPNEESGVSVFSTEVRMCKCPSQLSAGKTRTGLLNIWTPQEALRFVLMENQRSWFASLQLCVHSPWFSDFVPVASVSVCLPRPLTERKPITLLVSRCLPNLIAARLTAT